MSRNETEKISIQYSFHLSFYIHLTTLKSFSQNFFSKCISIHINTLFMNKTHKIYINFVVFIHCYTLFKHTGHLIVISVMITFTPHQTNFNSFSYWSSHHIYAGVLCVVYIDLTLFLGIKKNTPFLMCSLCV